MSVLNYIRSDDSNGYADWEEEHELEFQGLSDDPEEAFEYAKRQILVMKEAGRLSNAEIHIWLQRGGVTRVSKWLDEQAIFSDFTVKGPVY